MTFGALLLAVHVLGAIAWVGGMFFALAVLRPSMGFLESPLRLALHEQVFRRFFFIIWHIMPVMLVTGIAMEFLFYGGFATTPWPLQVMTGTGLAMAVLFVGIVGWFFIDKANFGPFNASGGSLYSGIGIAAGVALFSFIGVEAAAVTAKRVKNPRVNVGRASLLGTALSAILYVLVTAAVMGLVSHHTLVNTGSPFVNAFESIFPHEAWAGKFIAAVAVISGIGALNGWTLIVTETSRAIAQDDLFPRPFAWADRRGTAWFGIVVGTVLPSLLMLWRYNTSAGLTVFTYLVDLTVVTVAIPYFMSAIAQLTFLVSRRRRVQGWQLARDLSVAGASVLFSMWVTFASGYQVVYQALVVILVGLILYAFLNARRQRLGEAGEPVDLPPEEPAAELSTSA